MVRSGRLPEYRPPATTEGFEGYEQAINDSLLRLPQAGSILVGRDNLGHREDISREHFKLTWVNNPPGSVRISDGGERPSSNGTYIWTLHAGREGYNYVWHRVDQRGVLFFNSICICIGVTNRTPDGFILNLKVPGAQKEAFSYNSKSGLLVQRGDYLLSPWVIKLREQIQETPISQVQADSPRDAIKQALDKAKSMESAYKIHVGRNYQNAPKMAPHQGYFCRFKIVCGDMTSNLLIFVAKGGSTNVIRGDDKLDIIPVGAARIIMPGETLLFSDDARGARTWF